MEEQVEQLRHPGGRPLKFATVEDLDRAIARYFKSCEERHVWRKDWTEKRDQKGHVVRDEDGQPIWIKAKIRVRIPAAIPDPTGLAVALGVSRQTLKNYRARPEFVDSIERAYSICEAGAASQLWTSAARGAIFNLTNNYEGYEDKKVSDLQSKGEPIKALVEFIGDEDDDGDAATGTDSQG